MSGRDSDGRVMVDVCHQLDVNGGRDRKVQGGESRTTYEREGFEIQVTDSDERFEPNIDHSL